MSTSHDRELILQALETAGASQGSIYLAVPIGSGRREFELLRELNLVDRGQLRSLHPELWERRVKRPNEADARAYAIQAQAQYPSQMVINPAAIDRPGWRADDHMALWNRFLTSSSIDRMAVAPQWALSLGAREEVALAVELGIEVVDLFGRKLGPLQLLDEDSLARNALIEAGWSDDQIDVLLPALAITEDGSEAEPLDEDTRSASELFAWLTHERNYQNRKFGFEVDDDHTSEGLGEGSWWAKQLTMCWDLALQDGLETELGREHLAKFVATGCALLESVVRVFGSLPSPGVRTGIITGSWGRDGAGRKERDHHRIGAEVIAWLCHERPYQKQCYGLEKDDERLLVGLGNDGYWKLQFPAYWSRAVEQGLDTAIGRQALAKYVATGMGLLESAVRVYGQLPKREWPEDGLTDAA